MAQWAKDNFQADGLYDSLCKYLSMSRTLL